MLPAQGWIKWFEEISIHDIPLVGGKNASLGEMYRALAPRGIRIPPGFAVTADGFTELLRAKELEETIYSSLAQLDVRDVEALARTGHRIRSLIREAGLPASLAAEIRSAYLELCRRSEAAEIAVAVRSSATAEDLPDASFAGQQETFLNVRGEQELLEASLNCFASLFTDRAISYRTARGFDHRKVRLSVCVQRMVRADLGTSGVIFTVDTETGARNVLLVTSAYGLGENVVGGRVDPDEFVVSKPLLEIARTPILRRKVGAKQQRMVYSTHGSRRTRNIDVARSDRERLSLSDEDVIQLSRWSLEIERHYSGIHGKETPMDIEWGKDGNTGELFVLQARPETVHSNVARHETLVMSLSAKSPILLSGRAVGARIGAGPVKVIRDVSELPKFQEGDVLVADMTDPDWEPIMKKASAIVTNRGGRTCHAAIVSREHGVPCIVGTSEATAVLKDGNEVTVCCAEGDEGHVYRGVLPFTTERVNWAVLKAPDTQVMVNLGNPDQALKTSLLPVNGVGLARLEFIIAEHVKVHPMALVHTDKVRDERERGRILELIRGYEEDPGRYFVDRLSEGVAMIAGAFYPRPVIVRLSDFKTNEYANLLGGKDFEPAEENPMIGFRGASRYYDPKYRDGFALECRALKFVREDMGLKNVKVMVPFCRTPSEGELVLREMSKHGLVKGQAGLEVYVMSELPSNVLLASAFGEVFDGFSIGSNDLTQMILGVDRDSEVISRLFDERNQAVLDMLGMAIRSAKALRKPIGICGQAPSDYPEITRFLVGAGIDSISVTPDAVLKTIHAVLEAEANCVRAKGKE